MSLSLFTPIVADGWHGPAPATQADSLDIVRDYHERTKHRIGGYARGPETLDWDSAPAPFRRFEGTKVVPLARARNCPPLPELEGRSERQKRRRNGAKSLSASALGVFFEHCLGITAWKREGPDRWAVRANPSSGNLHPVEGYLLTRGVEGLADGVHHYRPDEHALAERASWAPASTAAPPRAWVALTSILWREAWKYGERAFRYTALDVGHAIGAVEHAAALFGWTVREERHVGWDTLARALGTTRPDDYPRVRFGETEHEEPEVLLALEAGPPGAPIEPATLGRWAKTARFQGRATPIDPRPMYSWPIVLDVARATRRLEDETPSLARVASKSRPGVAAAVIRRRRSARRFDSGFVLEPGAFGRLLAALDARENAALTDASSEPGLEHVLIVHRVQSLAPGVYLLPASGGARGPVAAELARRFDFRRVRGKARGGGHAFELFELGTAPPRELMRAARMLHCHQDIASTCSFSVAMLTELETTLALGAHAYRRVHRAAGRSGQRLYLGAEAEGLGGTGIGCSFDDAMLEFIGLAGTNVRSIYQFAVGKPLADQRIATEPLDDADYPSRVELAERPEPQRDA